MTLTITHHALILYEIWKGSIYLPGETQVSADGQDTVYDRIRTGIMGVTSYIPSINTVMRGVSAPELAEAQDSSPPLQLQSLVRRSSDKSTESHKAFIRFARKQELKIKELNARIEELSVKGNTFDALIHCKCAYLHLCPQLPYELLRLKENGMFTGRPKP